MKTPQLIERLKENLTIKILCFVIAFFIYLFYNISTLDTKVFSIPLEILQDGEVCITTTPTHFVRLTVKGKPEDMVQISEQDFTAVLDLSSYVEAGKVSVPILLYLSKQASLFSPLEYSSKPERLSLELDKKMTTYIPILPSITGELPKGYELGEIRLEPSFIEVEGPEKMILSLKEFKTKELSLENATSSFVKSLDLIQNNAFLNYDTESKIRALVDIQKIYKTKEFNTNTGNFIGLPDSLMVEEDFPVYSLQLRGFINDIEDFSLTPYSVHIDLFDIEKEGEYELPLLLTIPRDFEVLELEPQEISITIKQNTKLANED